MSTSRSPRRAVGEGAGTRNRGQGKRVVQSSAAITFKKKQQAMDEAL